MLQEEVAASARGVATRPRQAVELQAPRQEVRGASGGPHVSGGTAQAPARAPGPRHPRREEALQRHLLPGHRDRHRQVTAAVLRGRWAKDRRLGARTIFLMSCYSWNR